MAEAFSFGMELPHETKTGKLKLGAVGLGSNAGPHFCCEARLYGRVDGMNNDHGLWQALDTANQASPFHRIAGFVIEQAAAGEAVIAFEAAPQLLNHAGALHAGIQCAALDTVAGYAAATLAGPVVTLQLSTSFLSSAKGERFRAVGMVVKQGKAPLFVTAELFALRAGEERLLATASAVLTRL